MRLPNAERAYVDADKLKDYCLNPRHFRGRHKARVFSAALGYTADDTDLFRSILLIAAQYSEAERSRFDHHGQRYTVDFWMAGPRGQAWVRSSWMIRHGEDYPRFLTCYVL